MNKLAAFIISCLISVCAISQTARIGQWCVNVDGAEYSCHNEIDKAITALRNATIENNQSTVVLNPPVYSYTIQANDVLPAPPDPDPIPDPTPPPANAFFTWDAESSPIGDLYNPTPGHPFSEIEFSLSGNGQPNLHITDEQAYEGTKSIRITYYQTEDGPVMWFPELQLPGDAFVRTIDLTWFERFEGFNGQWPDGLKISRFFTGPRSNVFSGVVSSNKWYTGYSAGDQYGYQINNAIGNMDIVYPDGGELNPPIQDGQWYKIRIRMELNSGDGVPDGVMQQWINDVLLLDRHDIAFADSGRIQGALFNGWRHMWIGGNWSDSQPIATPAYRYIDNISLIIEE